MNATNTRARRFTPAPTAPVIPAIVATVSKPLCLGAFRLGFARAAERCPDSTHTICSHFGVASPDDVMKARSENLGAACQTVADGLGKVMRQDKTAARVILITAESLLRNPRPGYRGSVEDADVIKAFIADKLPSSTPPATLVTADWA